MPAAADWIMDVSSRLLELSSNDRPYRVVVESSSELPLNHDRAARRFTPHRNCRDTVPRTSVTGASVTGASVTGTPVPRRAVPRSTAVPDAPLAHSARAAGVAVVPVDDPTYGQRPRPAAPARRRHSARVLPPAGHVVGGAGAGDADDRARRDHQLVAEPGLARGGPPGGRRPGSAGEVSDRPTRKYRRAHRRRLRRSGGGRPGTRGGGPREPVRHAHAGSGRAAHRDRGVGAGPTRPGRQRAGGAFDPPHQLIIRAPRDGRSTKQPITPGSRSLRAADYTRQPVTPSISRRRPRGGSRGPGRPGVGGPGRG